MWCKKVALAIKEKTLKQNMLESKCPNNFWSQIFISFTGSPLYEAFWGIMCHSLLYFPILTYINYSVLHPLVKKQNQKWYLVSE